MRGKWLRGLRGAAVLSFWAVMMVLLVRHERETRRPAEAPPVEWGDSAPAAALTGEQWMGVYLNGAKLGYTVTRKEKRGDGLRLSGTSRLSLPLQGQMRDVRTDSSVDLDARQHMRSFTFTLDSEMHTMRVTGRQEPGKLLLDIETGGTHAKRTIPLAKPITIPDALTPLLAGTGQLQPNTNHVVEIFDPMALAPAQATVIIGEEETIPGVNGPVKALRTEMAYKGFRSTAWVTPSGETLKEESAMGWTMVRQSREEATRPAEVQPGADLYRTAAVPCNIPLKSPRQVKYLRAELTGADFSLLSLATDRQKVEKEETGLLEVRTEKIVLSQVPERPVSGPGMKPYLAPDVLVQSDDPDIITMAREIVGREANAWKAALLINRWVHEHIEKSPTISVPSAVEVLRTRKGDCNEHTVLFVALARAAGIPAEIAAGIVYVNDSFFYHAWPRVWVGQWVSLDPTFGQDIADATHIELVHGGLDRQSEIVRLFGRLRVRIIAAKE